MTSICRSTASLTEHFPSAFFSDLNIIDATEVNVRYGGYLVLTGKIGQTDLLANFLFIVREVIALLLETGHLLVHANDDLANA